MNRSNTLLWTTATARVPVGLLGMITLYTMVVSIHILPVVARLGSL